MFTVLLIEDDLDFCAEISEYLSRYKIAVSVESDISDLQGKIRTLNPDLLVLDQFIVGQDTLQLIPAIREYYSGGIVVFTGNVSLVDRVVALESGADDFITKQSDPRELLARLRSVYRRVRGEDLRHPHEESHAPLEEDESSLWKLDWARGEVRTPSGMSVRMTGTEFNFLMYSEERAGQLMSRAEISRDILHRSTTTSDRVIDNMVCHVRKLLDPHLDGDHAFRTVRGRGYVFIGLNNKKVRKGVDQLVAAEA